MNPQDYAARSAQPEEQIPVSTTPHRSDTPRRHRPNRLEMAATPDRTLAAIGNQRAQPASLWAEQRHDEPTRIG